MKKILTFTAALVMAAASMSAQDLVIVHLNDTHSHLEPLRESEPGKGTGGVIERAACLDSIRTVNGKRNVLLLHAGDFSQGAYATFSCPWPCRTGDLRNKGKPCP